MGMVIKATPLVLLCGLKTIYENATGCWIEGKFSLSPLEGTSTFSLTELFTDFGNCGMQGLGASIGLLHDQAEAQSLKGLQKPTWGALQLKKYIWVSVFLRKS